jgi:hypothetical protein
MKAVVFFIFMFPFLFSGSAHAYAANHQHAAVKVQQKATATTLRYKIINNPSIDDQDVFMIDDEVEDEYTNNSLAKKFKPINRHYLIFTDHFILSYLRNYSGDQHSISASNHSRFIKQRVLRI